MALVNQCLEKRLENLKEQGNYRSFLQLCKGTESFPYADAELKKEDKVMVCCSLDYLGMGQNPKVIDAAISTVSKSGVSSGGSRNLSGTTREHTLLEAELADFHEREASLVFNSGYLANQVTLSALGGLIDDSIFLSDELNHASIIEGIKVSKSRKVIFKHNDPQDLEAKLLALDCNVPKIVVFESIYSMEGDVAPVRELISVAKKYNALTIVNEVHAIGIFGEGGRGVCSRYGVMDQPDIIIGSLSKGVGAFGGYIVGSELLIDSVRSFGYGFIFTSSLPPSICAAAIASLKHLQSSDVERNKLLQNANLLRKKLSELGIRSLSSETHIVPVLVPGSERCNEVSRLLLEEYSIYAVAVNFPTVARGSERLRLVVTARHDEEMVNYLAESVAKCIELLVDETPCCKNPLVDAGVKAADF